MADFFDLDKFPGKRGMRRGPKPNLEFALIADGVPAAEVYDVLSTDAGIDRAFAKLDTIKDSVVWWEAGAQPPQLLADGEVVMTTAYNGRIFNAVAAEGKPFTIVWDGQIYDLDLWVIPKGAKNKDLAMDFLSFSTASTKELIKDIKIEAVYILPISEEALSPGDIFSSTKDLYIDDFETFLIHSLSFGDSGFPISE